MNSLITSSNPIAPRTARPTPRRSASRPNIIEPLEARIAPAAHVFGPDAFGYVGSDSLAPGAGNSEFIDISATGTQLAKGGAAVAPLTGGNLDDGFWQIPLGINFAFYGQAAPANLFVGTNGFATFNSAGATNFVNSIGSNGNPADPNAGLFAFWDDLLFNSTTPGLVAGTDIDSGLYYQVIGSGADRRMIVQWNEVPFLGGTVAEGHVTFQMQLFEGEGRAGEVRFEYAAPVTPSARAAGSSASIGIENFAGSTAAVFSENQASLSDLSPEVPPGDRVRFLTFRGPSVDLGVETDFVINANGTANSISYEQSDLNPAWGKVTVDDEVFHFANKTNLIINGLGGDDIISLNNPTTPTSLTGITVNGGDPTASDTLLIVGTGGSDTVVFTPTGFSSGSLTGLATPITFATTEHVIYDGNDVAAVDNITINGTLANDTFDYDASLLEGSFRSFASPDFDTLRSARISVNGGGAGVDAAKLVGSAGLDTVTSAANAISILTPGSLAIITLGAGMDTVTLSTLAGDDSVNLSGLGAPLTSTTIYGGEGNDILTGSPQADLIFGGAGNDTLIGGAGVDQEYGEDGNDIFGNPTLTSNGVADDAGADFAFGGPGFDNFVWEPGDGADFNNGDADGADIFRFFGDANANVFTLRAGGTPTHFNALIGAVNIDNHGIEDIVVDGQGGADTFQVDDLFTTEVVSVNLVLGTADAAVDSVTVNGRAANDTLHVSTPAAGSARISGLRYNVNVTTAEVTDLLALNGNAGHDTIDVAIGVAAVMQVTLSGGEGDDVLSGDALSINGGDGNDTLIGSAIDNTMNGGAGDDTFLGNGGTDAIGGGLGSSVGDTILLPGTAGNDVLSLAIDASGFLLATINGLTTTYTNFLAGPISTSGIERLKADGLDGADALTVDTTNGALAIPTTFDGGAASDSLTVTLGTAGTTAVTPGATPDAGVITSPDGTTNFSGIESATVTGLAAGANILNAQGTNASDTIALQFLGGANRFWVNDRAVVSFANFPTVNLNGLFGDDQFSVSPAGLVGVTAVNVAGGDPSASDELVITGTAAAETFTFAGTSPSAGAATITGAAPVAYTGTENVILDGQAGADVFKVASAKGRVQLRGGDDSDTVDFTGAAAGVIVDLDAVGVAQNVNTTGEIIVLGDVIENFIGTAFNDVLRVKAAPFARTVFGGVEVVLPPGDTLIFDGAGAVVNTVVVDANTGTFKTVGYADVAYDEFESKSIVNSPSGPGGFGTPGNSDAFSTAHIYDSLLFKSGGKPAPGKTPTAVATGDLNGDGFADLVVANSRSKNISILINFGDGTFADPVNISTGKASPQDLVLGDFDGDGNLDAVVSHPATLKISFFKGDGAGGFAAPTTTATPKFNPYALATGDLNGDGDLDLVAVSKATNAVAVILGNGAGVFTPGAPVKTLGKNSIDVVAADFNGDGDLDVATANVSSNNISFLAGDGTGALGAAARFATGVQPTSLAAADLDSDGDLDLAVSNAVSRFVTVLLSNGAAPAATQFAPQLRVAVPGLHQSTAIVVGDFDGDGVADLGLGNRASVNFTVLRGLGAGAYSQPYEFNLGKDPGASVTGGIALADFNNDGLLDIVATSLARSDIRVLLHKL